MPDFKKIETSQAPKALGPYSQAIFSPPFLLISGQIAVDPLTGNMAGSDIQSQTKQVLNNLEAILKASGCTFDNIVRYEIFLKDIEDLPIVNEECAKRFIQPVLPARQTVQVANLPLNALVEISCIAIQA